MRKWEVINDLNDKITTKWRDWNELGMVENLAAAYQGHSNLNSSPVSLTN